ncbi:MAG: hypothetical protein WA130_21490 [Candidatus Methanoperedens sp.]
MNSKKLFLIIFTVILTLVILSVLVYYQDDLTGNYDKILDNDKVTKEIIDLRVEKGLYFLHDNQLQSGGFHSYISNFPEMLFGEEQIVLFDSGFILHTLNLDDYKNTKEIVQEMKNKIINYFLKNRETHGVWRFYGKDQVGIPLEYQGPPDIDDTAIIYSGLVESGYNISDETLNYMLDYRKPDGTFLTWISSEEFLNSSNLFYDYYKKNDFDASVNANLLYAYSLKNRTQKGIVTYLNGVVNDRSFINGTLYYPSPYVFTYYLTKAYRDGNVKELEPSIVIIREYLLETQDPDGGWGNELHTALATISLINTGYDGKPLETAIKHILNEQKKNGNWKINGFYCALATPLDPPVYCAGSRELTTSFNLEALIKYRKMITVN